MVPIADDALNEPDEQFLVTLQAAVNATVAGAQGTGTITDNDRAPRLSIAGANAVEGSAGGTGGTMQFDVRLEPASGRTVTVNYATVDEAPRPGRTIRQQAAR